MVTQHYKDDLQENRLVALPRKLEPMAQGIHALVQSTFDENILLDEMIEDGNQTQSPENKLNENFAKKRVSRGCGTTISHKYVYTCITTATNLSAKPLMPLTRSCM